MISHKILIALTALTACINTTTLSAKPDHHKEEAAEESKTHKKRDKKADGIARQLKMIRKEVETLSSGTSRENIQRLFDWIDLLQAKVVDLLNKAEEKIEKYNARLNDPEATEKEAAKALDKLQSYQDKLEQYTELLVLIDDLKAEILKIADS